jgi:hypothetical protein
MDRKTDAEMEKELHELCFNYEKSEEEEAVDKSVSEFLYAIGSINKKYDTPDFANKIQDVIDRTLDCE